ncbi:MAG: hypothetical protein B7Y12_06190 [Rhizobiales bacterium 24-66-13]|jgi:ATP-dependent exoDNAse (exonuclease V) beta subunit|nr:MAG: hypothetical protein B7Y61_03845 [Rhizobiales bacterium 35-66-30]OYZ81793.1 MAG: hypothetical protein B7Y12_06190 [Rhizobiales bacterium 24-66-13]OZB09656.1 MAG: hypothetical protein B7X67_06845 [Rhizobiales bacterium 39-66-18]
MRLWYVATTRAMDLLFVGEVGHVEEMPFGAASDERHLVPSPLPHRDVADAIQYQKKLRLQAARARLSASQGTSHGRPRRGL